jgi:hypothetical protein
MCTHLVMSIYPIFLYNVKSSRLLGPFIILLSAILPLL